MKLKLYFKAKIGASLRRNVVRHRPDGEPDERQFRAEVLEVGPMVGGSGTLATSVLVNLESERIYPGGAPESGSRIVHGDLIVPLGTLDGLEDFWRELLRQAAPEWGAHVGDGPTH